MTAVKIIYNPFQKHTTVFIDGQEVTSIENKLYSFLRGFDIDLWLYPFTKRYVIWRGILTELINETNDDELNIVFEGRDEDFDRFEQALYSSGDIVENEGFHNSWKLSHIQNFEADQLREKIISFIKTIKEFSTTRHMLLMLGEIEASLPRGVSAEAIEPELRKLHEVIEAHIEGLKEDTQAFGSDKAMELPIWVQFLNALEDIGRW